MPKWIENGKRRAHEEISRKSAQKLEEKNRKIQEKKLN